MDYPQYPLLSGALITRCLLRCKKKARFGLSKVFINFHSHLFINLFLILFCMRAVANLFEKKKKEKPVMIMNMKNMIKVKNLVSLIRSERLGLPLTKKKKKIPKKAFLY